jgi:hypothetical protein
MIVPCAATLVVEAVAPVKRPGACEANERLLRKRSYPVLECERPMAGASIGLVSSATGGNAISEIVEDLDGLLDSVAGLGSSTIGCG